MHQEKFCKMGMRKELWEAEEGKAELESEKKTKCDSLSSELEKLYDAIKEFDPTPKKESLTREEKKAAIREGLSRGASLMISGLKSQILPADPLSLRHHVKELKVNSQLKKLDKHLHRVNFFHKAGVEWLAVSVLLIVESIFFAYPAVSIGITVGIIAIMASGVIFQNYFTNVDRKKLALKMERHSYRQLDPEIGNVPGHPEALQELKSLTERYHLDSAQGTQASLQAGRTIPDHLKRKRRMFKWIPFKTLRQWVDRGLYRDISRAGEVKPDAYSKELKQVRARLFQRLREYSESELWSTPDSMDDVSQLYADQQRLQSEKERLEAANKGPSTPLSSKLENQQRLREIDEELSKLRKKIDLIELIQSMGFVKSFRPVQIKDVKSAADPAKKHLSDTRKRDGFKAWKAKYDEYVALLEKVKKIDGEQDKIWPSQEAAFGNILELERLAQGHRPRLKAGAKQFAAQVQEACECASVIMRIGLDYSVDRQCKLKGLYDASEIIDKKRKEYEEALKRAASIKDDSKKKVVEHAIAQEQAKLINTLSYLSSELLKEYRELQRILKEEVQKPLADHRRLIMNVVAGVSEKLSKLEKKIPKQVVA